MTWFKVDDGFAFHHKVISAGNAAIGLWVRAGTWSAANLTEGALPKHMVGTLGAQKRDAAKLVAVGLWRETDEGYQFRDWAHYQPAKEQVDARKEADRVRQQRHRGRARHGVTDGVTDGVTPAVTNGTPSRPVPSSNEEEETTAPRKRGRRIPDDFKVTDQMREWANAEGFDRLDLDQVTVEFVDYWSSESGSKAVKVDWLGTWRNRVRAVAERMPSNVRSIRRDQGNRHVGEVQWALVNAERNTWQECHPDGFYVGCKTVWLPVGERPA